MNRYCNCKLPVKVSSNCRLFPLLSVFHHLVHDRLLALAYASFLSYFIDRMIYSCHSLSDLPCCSHPFSKELGLQEAPLDDYCVFVCQSRERKMVYAFFFGLSKCCSIATSVDFHAVRESLKRIQLRCSFCQTTSE